MSVAASSHSDDSHVSDDSHTSASVSGRSTLDHDKRNAFAIDPEKDIGFREYDSGGGECNIVARAVSTTPSHPAKSLRSMKSHHSRAGVDGYTCFDADYERQQHLPSATQPNSATPASPEEPFLVKWEGGDADPQNPRSMSKMRRWCIVFIVSSSSLCVCVSTFPLIFLPTSRSCRTPQPTASAYGPQPLSTWSFLSYSPHHVTENPRKKQYRKCKANRSGVGRQQNLCFVAIHHDVRPADA